MVADTVSPMRALATSDTSPDAFTDSELSTSRKGPGSRPASARSFVTESELGAGLPLRSAASAAVRYV
ncbi:hypothetical protein D3C87_2178550 [compost metagenome]